MPVTPYGLPADEPYAKVAETSVKVGAEKETGDKPGAGKAEKEG